MASVFKVLAGISRPPRAPIKFSVDEDVTVKELAIKDRTSDTTEAIIKMLQFGYNESFLNIYRSIFGGIVIPLVLGIIMFWINFFIDSWAVSLTVSPLTIIPALLIYLNNTSYLPNAFFTANCVSFLMVLMNLQEAVMFMLRCIKTTASLVI